MWFAVDTEIYPLKMASEWKCALEKSLADAAQFPLPMEVFKVRCRLPATGALLHTPPSPVESVSEPVVSRCGDSHRRTRAAHVFKCSLCAFALFCHVHEFLISQDPDECVASPFFCTLYYYRIITPPLHSLAPYEGNRTRSKSISGTSLVKIIENDAPLDGSVSWMAREAGVSM